jgi:hypothetical protein
MSWGKGLEEEDTFCYTTDSQVVGQKPIVERVNFQALPTLLNLEKSQKRKRKEKEKGTGYF